MRIKSPIVFTNKDRDYTYFIEFEKEPFFREKSYIEVREEDLGYADFSNEYKRIII